MRATPALTVGEMNTRMLNEDAAIRYRPKYLLVSKPYVLAIKVVEPIKYARITVVLIQKDTYLKNVGSSFQNLKQNSRPRSGIPMVTRARKPHPAPGQRLTHGASKV
jgi:hypothetical protein